MNSDTGASGGLTAGRLRSRGVYAVKAWAPQARIERDCRFSSRATRLGHHVITGLMRIKGDGHPVNRIALANVSSRRQFGPAVLAEGAGGLPNGGLLLGHRRGRAVHGRSKACLLYTSDA